MANDTTTTLDTTTTETITLSQSERENALLAQGANEGAARILARAESERDRAILAYGRAAGARGVRGAIRAMVREDHGANAKGLALAHRADALAFLRGMR